MTPAPAARAGPPGGADDGLAAHLRHDGPTQHRAAVLGHAYRVRPHDLFRRHRAELSRAWPDLAGRDPEDRAALSALLLVRCARELADGRPDPDPGPSSPPGSPSAHAAAADLLPRWGHPDPWTLLAPADMLALRALVHLEPDERDLAAAAWLGVDDAAVAAEAGLSPAAHERLRDEALALWALVVRAARP